MLIITLLRFSGALLLGMFAMNFFVPGKFRWAEDFAKISRLNRQIFQVHAIFIALILLLMGLLLITLPWALIAPDPLARAVLCGLLVFWSVRLVLQWFFYDAALWRGKNFETAMHFAFTGLWLFLTATFAAALVHSFHA